MFWKFMHFFLGSLLINMLIYIIDTNRSTSISLSNSPSEEIVLNLEHLLFVFSFLASSKLCEIIVFFQFIFIIHIMDPIFICIWYIYIYLLYMRKQRKELLALGKLYHALASILKLLLLQSPILSLSTNLWLILLLKVALLHIIGTHCVHMLLLNGHLLLQTHSLKQLLQRGLLFFVIGCRCLLNFLILCSHFML